MSVSSSLPVMGAVCLPRPWMLLVGGLQSMTSADEHVYIPALSEKPKEGTVPCSWILGLNKQIDRLGLGGCLTCSSAFWSYSLSSANHCMVVSSFKLPSVAWTPPNCPFHGPTLLGRQKRAGGLYRSLSLTALPELPGSWHF